MNIRATRLQGSMNVLDNYANYLWDYVAPEDYWDAKIARKVLRGVKRIRKKLKNGYFELGKHNADVGICDFSGEFGVLAQVNFWEYEQ